MDFVAASHAIWYGGRTVVFLSTRWTPDVVAEIVSRCSVSVVLYGAIPPPPLPTTQLFCTSTLVESSSLSLPISIDENERISVVPIYCSITPTSGSTGAPKSVLVPMRRGLPEKTKEIASASEWRDGRYFRGSSVSGK